MTKLQKSKKGFTLTELAIVIAVIAILIAVLVPTFVSLINKANESNDKQLVKNLNTALSTEEITDGKATTMSEALEIAEDNGYKVENLIPTSEGYNIIWDQVENQFLLVEDSTVVYPADVTLAESNAYRYWYIVNSASDYTTYSANACSLYINCDLAEVASKGGVEYASGITSTATAVSATATDTSTSSTENKALASTAVVTASSTTSIPQIIIITNGGTLSVEVKGNAEVSHSGSASTVTVVEASNYVVNATVTELNITSGSVTVSSSATINTITADSSISVNIETCASVTQVAGGATVSGDTSSVSVLGTADNSIKYNETTYYATSTYVQLTEDKTISEDIIITDDLLLDLNGNSLTLSGYITVKGNGSLTICDTSANSSGKIVAGSTSVYALYITENGTVTLNSGTIYNLNGNTLNEKSTVFRTIYVVAYGAENTASFIMNGGTIECISNGMYSEEEGTSYGPEAIFLMPASYTETGDDYTNATAYVEINGGTITTQGYYCISTNGKSTHGVENIIINGGTLTAYNGDVMYLPANGTTTINGGTLQSICGVQINSGNNYGCGDGIDESYDTIEIKGGTLYINGGTFYTNGTYSDKALTPASDGTTPAGAAINVCSKTGYSGNIVVIISGGSFTSVNGNAINICLAEGTSETQVRSVSISGGTYSYNSSHYAVQCTINGASVTIASSLGLKTSIV